MGVRTVRRPNEEEARKRPRDAAARRCAVSRGGRRVRIRAVSPEDLEPLRRMFARLSPRSVYRRFHAPYPVVPEWVLDYSVHVDHAAGESLVAVSGGEIVGQAMYVRSEGGSEAEVAVAVEDAWQRRGIGGFLLAELAASARRRGIEAFTGAVLHENGAMLRLAAAVRARIGYSVEEGAYLIHLPLEPDQTWCLGRS